MKAILDTSVLIARQPLPPDVEAGISSISLAELHFGVLKTQDAAERARRIVHLGRIESAFATHPLDGRVARALGQVQAAVSSKGGRPRARTADLVIAATALAHGALLFTRNYKDFKLVDDLVDVREPPS
ncbi:MAG TPA: PIN domain-containing protein [Solirubrobacterales bacterium]|nr:PIN domain-containing protein [Solirubrobacterales bacterium]